MEQIKTLPPQQLSFAAKTVSWRKKHLDWADNHSSLTNTRIRKLIRDFMKYPVNYIYNGD